MTLRKKISLLTFSIFLLTIISWFYISLEDEKINDQLLDNEVTIEGIVEEIKISDNHCFAIIYLKNVVSTPRYFNLLLRNKSYPYIINNLKSEVFCTQCESDSTQRGDTLILDSKRKRISIMHKRNKLKINQNLEIIIDGSNIDYIKRNSKLLFTK